MTLGCMYAYLGLLAVKVGFEFGYELGSGADQPTSTAGTPAASTTPPWTCVDCGHENPPGATFCRGCASTQDDDREPRLAGYNSGEEPS